MVNSPYKLREKVVGDVVILEVTGRLDLPSDGHDGLLTAVERRLQEGRMNFLLHLGRVRMVTSMGIGGIINILRVLEGRGGALKLLAPSFSVRHLLQISKLESLFEMFDDEALAVSSFAQDREREPGERRATEAKRLASVEGEDVSESMSQ
jgi:anti-sigma B factor antagonist